VKLHVSLTLLFEVAGLVCTFVGLVSLGLMATNRDLALGRVWHRYVTHLERGLRFLFLDTKPRAIVMGQLGVLTFLGMAVAFVPVEPLYVVFAVSLTLLGPTLWLASEKKKRIEQIELQIDPFILALANGLKTVPSPGAAVQAIAPVLRDPMRQEIDRVIKEMRVGSTLEQALITMSSRVGSKSLDSALSSVLIGIQVGGNLPAVLETTAQSIREMNRLDGVVKTKTSEGRAQLWVLAVFPFALCLMFNWAQPGYFDPLQESVIGYIIVTVAAMFWIAALIAAKKILTVDI